MRREQRIFHDFPGFTVLLVVGMALCLPVVAGGERVLVADGKVSIELAEGWLETDRNTDQVLAGFMTQDQRHSMFLTRFQAGGSLQEVLDATIDNFDQRFPITRETKAVTGQAKGPAEKKWPAIYQAMEAEVPKGDKVFEMRFYLYVFDTGTSLYLLQGSATLPVREAREAQIIEMIRSVVAKP